MTALAGADLIIDRGELLGVVGPSGSGKSTLLNIMGTLARPTTGTVRINRHPVDELYQLSGGEKQRVAIARAAHSPATPGFPEKADRKSEFFTDSVSVLDELALPPVALLPVGPDLGQLVTRQVAVGGRVG